MKISPRLRFMIVMLLIVGVGSFVLAQQGGGRGGRGGRGGGGSGRGGGGFGGGGFGGGGFGGGGFSGGSLPADRNGIPTWDVDPQFKKDLFTFVRVQYDSYGRGGGRGGGGGGGWRTDFPDSDLNFPFRLQQMTSMKVDPTPISHRLTDPEIFNYPFVYMLEVGALVFSDEEVESLRRYCLNGGFLMVDDFWGEEAWENFYREIKRVFPDREPTELPLEHPIFHNVFNLKERPQIPAIGVAQRSRAIGRPEITWEREDAREAHYRGIFDDKGRMMVIICQNTDLGDGWEREGEDEYYFHEFSEKKAYPMGINIVVYAMTH